MICCFDGGEETLLALESVESNKYSRRPAAEEGAFERGAWTVRCEPVSSPAGQCRRALRTRHWIEEAVEGRHEAQFVVCLTFEVRRGRRWDARPRPQKMYTLPVAGAWRPAVGARLDRRVRPRCCNMRFGRVIDATQSGLLPVQEDLVGRQRERC